MGDAIMAFWNAPLDDTQHQLNACEAALDMLERVDELNREREQEAEDGGTFTCRSTSASASTPAPAWSAIWLRRALRLFGVSATASIWPRGWRAVKEYGFPIIVGSKTALAVKEKFAILELDFIMVKGKRSPR